MKTIEMSHSESPPVLLPLIAQHDVRYHLVKGHANNNCEMPTPV